MLPRVVIAGRPNVGKSALFNSLLRRRVAIVDPTPGITRDVLEQPLDCAGSLVILVDTGGLGESEDPLAEKVRRRAEAALAGADLAVLVVDARSGLAAEDRVIARRLHRLKKPVLLVANKCDVPALEPQASVFDALGFGPAMPVSAAEGREMAELREGIAERLPETPAEKEEGALRIVVLGKRNAGKSTLVNALCGSDRMMVDPLAGTTRDAVEVPFRAKGGAYAAIDTAGFRREGRLEHPVEIYAAARTREALQGADVALLLLDATQPVSALDKKIAREIRDAAKPVLIAVNKWDLMGSVRTGQYQAHLEDALRGLDFAPLVFISAKEGRNLKSLLHIARSLSRQASVRLGTAALNRALERALQGMPGPGGGRTPKILFAAQVATRPPTIALTVNHLSSFPPAYRRALEQRLRSGETPFKEVPIRLLLRERASR